MRCEPREDAVTFVDKGGDWPKTRDAVDFGSTKVSAVLLFLFLFFFFFLRCIRCERVGTDRHGTKVIRNEKKKALFLARKHSGLKHQWLGWVRLG